MPDAGRAMASGNVRDRNVVSISLLASRATR